MSYKDYMSNKDRKSFTSEKEITTPDVKDSEALVEETSTTEEIETEEIETEVIEPTNDIISPLSGQVTNCTKLNVREQPNQDSKVIKVLNKGEYTSFNPVKSTDEWYSLLSGGYCMKKYITLND